MEELPHEDTINTWEISEQDIPPITETGITPAASPERDTMTSTEVGSLPETHIIQAPSIYTDNNADNIIQENPSKASLFARLKAHFNDLENLPDRYQALITVGSPLWLAALTASTASGLYILDLPIIGGGYLGLKWLVNKAEEYKNKDSSKDSTQPKHHTGISFHLFSRHTS